MRRNLYLSVAACLAIGVFLTGMAFESDSKIRALGFLAGPIFICLALAGLYLGWKYRDTFKSR